MRFNGRSPLDWFVAACLVAALLLAASRASAATCNVLITTYGGAVGDGTTDNTTAIQNTFNYAHTNGCTAEIPAGTFAYSNVLTANGITVFGLGPNSILKATNTNDEALELTGSGGSITNLVMLGIGTSRLTTYQASMIWVSGATNFTIANNLINGGSCVGIYNAGGQNGTIQNNTVENTLADAITNTSGAATVTDMNNLVINSGDDGISNNSYVSDGSLTVNHITITGNTVLNNVGGRGLEVSGGNNITYSGNYIDNKDGYTDIYIASESEFNTQSVSAITASANTLIDGGPNQGSIIVYNSQGSGQTVSGVTLNGNRFHNPALSAVQYAGNGLLSTILTENNVAYMSTSSGFSFSSNTDGSSTITETSNTVITPSAYPGPLSAPVGGTVPLFSLPGGSYLLPQSLTLVNGTSGDSISYCTTAGSTCVPGTTYSGAITISSAETVCTDAVNSSSLIGVTSATVCQAYASSPPSNCQLSPGASVSAIQAAINLAASNSCTVSPPQVPNGSTVYFSPGSYTISSLVTIPCPTTAMTITGPVVPYVHPASLLPGSYSYASPYTAILNGTLTSSSGWQVNACGVADTIQYFEWNGNQQSGGGGGWLDVAGGTSNLTVQYNYAHGNWASTSTPHNYDDLIVLDGVGFSQTPIDSNVRIIWNQFGNGASDCNPIMNLFTYQGDSYIRAGGYCGAVGVHVSTTNLVIQNNDFEHLEQPLKFFQGSSSAGDITHTFMLNNALIDSNDFGQVHRIGIEAQQSVVENNSTGGVFTFSNNSFHDPISPDYGLFGASLPMCCSGFSGYSTNDNQVNCNNNSMGENVTPVSFIGGAFEWWSTGSCNNNLMQGWWGSYNNAASTGAIEYGFTSTTVRTWVASNNTCQFTLSGGVCVGNEGEQSTSSPIQSGNVTTTTIAPVTSIAPTISPAPGSKSYPLTVTLTDPGYTTGSVPQGNTGVWYTIDGTTPVPGSGSSQYLSTGQTFVLAGPATVQAVGMWGALNQPTNYPSGGYGWAPSAVVSAVYTTSGAVTLSSVTIAATGGVATLNVGQTVQMIVICHYSDGSMSGCNTTDSHGNAVTAWSSSNGNVAVSSSGLATAAAVGTATVTATVTGGVVTSPGFGLTVNAPPLTLSSITVATTGGVTSITAPANNQLLTTCHYNDGTATSCNTMDSHGNAVTSAASSAPAIATVTSPGSLATGVAAGSTNLTTTVTPTPSMLGTSLQNVSGSTNNGFINEIYGVTGTSAGSYTPGNCHITIPATTNWTAGKLWTCLLVLGTPTTQNSSAVCSASFTMTGTSWPGGDIVIPMTCPTLPPDTGYWVGSTTNQTTASPAQGFSNCGGNCSGGPPVFGSGTYSYSYVANPFGNYTALPTTLNQTGTTPGLQVSQYILLTTTPVTSNTLALTVNAAPPTLLSAYITGASALVVPNTAQMAAKCRYTSGPDQDCTVADIYGNAVSAWLTSDATKATVQNVGGASPGLVTAVAAGTSSITAVINNAMNSTAYPITVTNPAISLTGITLSTAGGVTGIFLGNTNQLKATCSYSDGSNDDCTNTDAHGNKANTWTSTTPSHASINATTGLVTGVAPGTTTFTAKAGTFTSPALPLTVLSVPSGVYTITIRGPIRFSGTVRF